MSEGKQTTLTTLRRELNAIADVWTASNELPADTSWADVNERSTELCDQLDDYILTLKKDTTLGLPEAVMWSLSNTVGAQHTSLTDDAIVMILLPVDTPFKPLAEALDEITTSAVQTYAAEVDATVERARNLSITTMAPEKSQSELPELVVLDRDTKRRLQNAAMPAEEALDAAVSRVLDQTETQRSLREFGGRYLDERGRENVNQFAVEEIPLRDECLSLTVHGARAEEDPEVVSETDKITVEGRQFDFHIVEDPYGPHTFERVPIYGWTDADEEDVALNEGVAVVRERVRELLAGGELVQ
jgi:hypothetical protein